MTSGSGKIGKGDIVRGSGVRALSFTVLSIRSSKFFGPWLGLLADVQGSEQVIPKVQTRGKVHITLLVMAIMMYGARVDVQPKELQYFVKVPREGIT